MPMRSTTARNAEQLGMNMVHYDPQLSIENALKLPRSIQLTSGMMEAVSNADYISLNIPYIKGMGGTHGIIGEEVVGNMKEGAVVLNFACGELVDIEAMKKHHDNNNGRYVSDFPDDLLWNHPSTILLASMAAETVRDFLETGAIRNSVNLTPTSLPNRPENSI